MSELFNCENLTLVNFFESVYVCVYVLIHKYMCIHASFCTYTKCNQILYVYVYINVCICICILTHNACLVECIK